MDPVAITLVFVCLACLVSVVFQVRALWRCWTGLFVVSGNRCFYVCGYKADDLLGLSNPKFLNHTGGVFLENGNKVGRLGISELINGLSGTGLGATEGNLRNNRKICVVGRNRLIELSV